MEHKHTEAPWFTDGRHITSPNRGKLYQEIAVVSPGTVLRKVDRANAEFIVKACNSHASDQKKIKALVGACEDYFAAKGVFQSLDPNNSDCGPEVMQYHLAGNQLKAMVKLAKETK